MDSFQKVVICGAGFAGVSCALTLSKSENFEITVINSTSYHTYHADLYEVATARLDHENKIDFQNLEGTVRVPLEEIFANSRVKIVVENIEAINLNDGRVEAQNNSYSYDYLVLALGSKTNFFGTPGAENYAHPLKNVEDALNIRNSLLEISQTKAKVDVVIVGGGFTGVELAGEMAISIPKNCQISLLEATENLLSGMPSWAQLEALKRLESLGVKVLVNHKIEKVTAENVLCCEGKNIIYDYLVWTAGVKGENLQSKIGDLESNQKGQIMVGSDLSIKQFPKVFVAGDLAEYSDAKGSVLPSTAWIAIGEGKVVAENIVAKEHGKSTNSYLPSTPSFIVPVGSKFALSNFSYFKLSGVLGWVMKRLVAFNYFSTVLPFHKAIKLWRKGVKIFIQND